MRKDLLQNALMRTFCIQLLKSASGTGYNASVCFEKKPWRFSAMKKIPGQMRTELEALADPAYQNFTAKLRPTLRRKILGVRLPALRAYAKKLVKTGRESEALKTLGEDECYEETVLKALVLCELRLTGRDLIERVDALLPELDGWGACDTLVAALKDPAAHGSLWWDYLSECFADPLAVKRRFAFVAGLMYFASGEHFRELLRQAARADGDEYYVMMAAAWCIAEVCVFHPEETLDLLRSGACDPRTALKAVSKICESYRVSAKVKARARALRSEIKKAGVKAPAI